jgi:carboxymethylenebutenolidase
MPSFWENTKVDGEEMGMYVSVPGGSGPFPAVVVIHHGAGVDQFSRDMTDKLAEGGYAAVAPDLMHRLAEDSPLRSAHPRERLNDREIESDVNATVEFLRNHPSIQGDNLGIIGFCMGGRVVWLMAAANSHLKAAVPYYGGNIMEPWGQGITSTPFDRANEINGAVLFHFGVEDENPSQDDMAKLDAELARLGVAHEFFTYPDAGHSFMDHTNQQAHRPAAVEASWPRTLDFFAKHLK